MKQEHNVRYDFNILLVATLLTETEKTDIVEKNRGKFEPQIVETKKEDLETYVIVDEENSTEPMIKCKFCDLKVSSRLELKNHMMNDHAIAKTDKPNVKVPVEPKLAIPAAAKTDIPNDKVLVETKTVAAKTDKPNEKVSVETKTAVPAAKESIEGVLKCKVCGKYIKQSLMAEHKAKHVESEKAEKQNDKNTDGKSKNKIEEVSKAKVSEKTINERPVETKISNTKPTVNNSEKKAEPLRIGKRKTLADKDWEEEDNDDSDDEDFDPLEKAKVDARHSPKQQPCKYYSKKFGRFCSKKFSSKVRLLSHMRVSHETKPHGQ